MKRKIVALVLTVVMACGLVACGSNKTTTETEESTVEATTEEQWLSSIRLGKIKSWDELHDRYQQESEQYAGQKLKIKK